MHGPPSRSPDTVSERVIAGVFITVILGLFVAELCTNYTPVKLSALLITLFWIPLLALHEAGHAVAAHLLGWRVDRVVIGMGNSLGRFWIGRTEVEVRWFPVEGFALCAPVRPKCPRLESGLVSFAGPGVELLLALLILLFVGPDRLFRVSPDYWLIVWQSLALTATIGAVLNLIPMSVQTQSGFIANDGLNIWRCLFPPRDRRRRRR